MSKNARRAEARERARIAREAARRRERRHAVLVRSGIIAGVLAVVTVVSLVLVGTMRPAGPGPRNMASDGIVIGEGLVAAPTPALAAGARPSPAPKPSPAHTPSPAPTPSTSPKPAGAPDSPADIRVYLDYLCPLCGQFEKENGDYLRELVDSGAATIDYHPVAILDRASLGSKYSTRSAAAAACVADLSPNSFFDVNSALFAKQPAEGTSGLSNAELAKAVTGVKGVDDKATIDDCIHDQRFAPFVTESTKRALTEKLPGTTAKKLTGTPTVFVDGKQFDSSKQTFREFMTSALGEHGAAPQE